MEPDKSLSISTLCLWNSCTCVVQVGVNGVFSPSAPNHWMRSLQLCWPCGKEQAFSTLGLRGRSVHWHGSSQEELKQWLQPRIGVLYLCKLRVWMYEVAIMSILYLDIVRVKVLLELSQFPTVYTALLIRALFPPHLEQFSCICVWK